MPNVYIIAGPNGAGKTTFAKEFLPKYAKCDNFINADVIAQDLGLPSSRIVMFKAGRSVLRQIQNLVLKEKDFAFETTLSGRTYLPILKKVKQKGYVIHLFFLWVPSVELSLARISDRVSRGGHDVPEKDVRRRFHRGLDNLFHLYKPLLDGWTLFDNSTTNPDLIAKEEYGTLTVVRRDLYSQIIKIAGLNYDPEET